MATISTDRQRIPDKMMRKLKKRAKIIQIAVARNDHPFGVLERLYRYVDEALPKLYPAPTCKRGCSHCCYMAVGITGLEALHIEKRTGHKVTNLESGPVDTDQREPCVFLKNNECSIYEHRPMVCRVFMSFDDVKYCIDETAADHYLLRLNPPGKGGFDFANAVYMHVITEYARRDERYRTINDIRGFFGPPTPPTD